MTPTATRSLVLLALIYGSSSAICQRAPQWRVESKATVTIGASETDTTDLLTTVVGATRLPDGNILVGDHGAFALRLFSPEGHAIRAFGRKGAGPGEIGYLKALLRCGDSLVTMDLDGNRTSVFSLDGRYVRVFRFGRVQTTVVPGGAVATRQPYASACSPEMRFVHYGWEEPTDLVDGAFRPPVPFWISPADSTIREQFGTLPGSERLGNISSDGKSGGSRPLPLGKQTRVAVGSDRVYIGTGDRYEILVFDRTGRKLESIRAPRATVPTSTADINRFKAVEMSGMDDARRARAWERYAIMPFPKTLPAHGALVVDAAGNLWIQDYPRPTSNTVAWSIFDPQAREIASAMLPSNLEVYEIGRDYVLGRYFDPEEAIPQVRLYTLRRVGR